MSDDQARLLLNAPAGDTVKARRDRAIIADYLFHALRRSELADLRVVSMGERRGVMHFTVLGKGSKTRYVPVHPAALSAINDYLAAAGHGEDRAGPLFRPVRNNVTGTLENAMTGGGIYDMVRRYGRQAGITVDGSAFTPCAPRSAQTPSNTKLTSPTCRCGSAMPIYKHHAPL